MERSGTRTTAGPKASNRLRNVCTRGCSPTTIRASGPPPRRERVERSAYRRDLEMAMLTMGSRGYVAVETKGAVSSKTAWLTNECSAAEGQ